MSVQNSLPPTFVQNFHDETTIRRMPTNVLGNTGMVVSKISFGASSLGNVFRTTNENESVQVVHEALKGGINYIDVAPWYGHGVAETVLGKALKDIPRSAYYIATKVGRYRPEVDQMFDFSAERTLRSVDESLQRLGLDYLDVIQVHDMEFAPSLDIIINETLPALQKIKDSGKAKFIGITGYPLDNFKTVLERSTVKIDTILTYCRYTLNDDSLSSYLPFFQERGIGIINASPISMGLLSSRGPPEWHPARDETKQVCAEAAKYCTENGCDISRLAMAHTLECPGIHTTLFSTASMENLKKNMKSVNSPLNDNENKVLKDIIIRYMEPLKYRHWEGVEVEHYRKQLAGSEDVGSFKLG